MKTIKIKLTRINGAFLWLMLAQALFCLPLIYAQGDGACFDVQKYKTDFLSPQITIQTSSLKSLLSYTARFMEKTDRFSLGLDIQVIKSRHKDFNDLLISDGKGSPVRISVPCGNSRPDYERWISSQYGTMALDDYPHLTSKLMLSAMLAEKEIFKDAVVLEAGSGDGILSVFAERLGARKIYAVDNNQAIMKVAEEVFAENDLRDVRPIKGNFYYDTIDFEQEPTVLILNVGVYVQENLQKILEKYPSLKYVFLVGENLHVYGEKERFYDLVLKLEGLGRVRYSNYFEQPVYYQDVSTEGYWGIVLEIGSRPGRSREEILGAVLNNRLINLAFARNEKSAFRGNLREYIKKFIYRGDEVLVNTIDEVESLGEEKITALAHAELEEFNREEANRKETTVHTWQDFAAIDTAGEYDLIQLLAHRAGAANNYLQLMDEDPEQDSEFYLRMRERFRDMFRRCYLILRGIEIASREIAPRSEKDARERSGGDLLEKISPYLREMLVLLDNYRSEGVISRYFLSGSFLDGELAPGGDIDFAVTFRSYKQQMLASRLMKEAERISARAGFDFHITPEAFGYEYDLVHDKIISAGIVRGEKILARLKNPEEKSLLRLDNVGGELFSETYLLNLFDLCRSFDFKNANNKRRLNAETRVSLPAVSLRRLDDDPARLEADRLSIEFENRNILFLDSATDVDFNFAYEVDVPGKKDLKLILLARDLEGYSRPNNPGYVPGQFYVSVVRGDKVIGYGAVESEIISGEHSGIISFRIFKGFRKGLDSAAVFKTLMSAARDIFDEEVTQFVIPFHQINEEEGINSAAVLFYLKLGFKHINPVLRERWKNEFKPILEQKRKLSREQLRELSNGSLSLKLSALPENELPRESRADFSGFILLIESSI